MRLPNGFGNVSKLPGNRRKPYRVRVTIGWELDTETGINKQKYWMSKNDCEYLLSTPEGKHFAYRNYYDSYWTPLIEQMGMDHRPHDTRHTCISLLTVAGVQDKIIKKIVGHKGQTVTEVVYTHFEIQELLEAINKI